VHSALKFVGLVALIVSVAGCDTGPKQYPATGTVTYDGNPVDGASVTFVSDTAPMGIGTTDSAGKFTILTGGKPGAPLGTYKVTVTKSAQIEGMPASPTAEDMKNMAAKGPLKSKALVPAKYAIPQSTDLSVTVTEDAAKNVFPLDLK
jgi:hypothetical protein